MKTVVLIFPDTIRMAEFILKYRIGQAEVNSAELTLTARMHDDLIVAACTSYEAVLKVLAIPGEVED